jgi:hypothetical protein
MKACRSGLRDGRSERVAGDVVWTDANKSDPLLEWAVMADPSGNEFCLIRELEQTL